MKTGARSLLRNGLQARIGVVDNEDDEFAEIKSIETPLNFSDEDVAMLTHFHEMQELQIPNSTMTDAGLSHLVTLRQLKSLSIGSQAITDAGVFSAFTNAKSKGTYGSFISNRQRGGQTTGDLRNTGVAQLWF